MSWAAVFWILYGVGSTLFVVYLFRLGNSVVTNHDQFAGEEIARNQRGGIDDTAQLAAFSLQGVSRETGGVSSGRLHVERIFQPNDDYLAVQGVRNGATCVINLPLGMLGAESDASSRPGRGAREC